MWSPERMSIAHFLRISHRVSVSGHYNWKKRAKPSIYSYFLVGLSLSKCYFPEGDARIYDDING